MATSQPTEKLLACVACAAQLPVKVGYLGKKCRCRGCGLIFVVTEEQWKRAVAATSGEASSGQVDDLAGDASYQLWGVDEAPLPSAIARRQPQWFPVYCLNCNTLMHATMAQVGTNLVCHDCGAKTVVKTPPHQPVPPPILPDDGYELDEASAPTPRPSALPALVRREEEERKNAMKSGAHELRQSSDGAAKARQGKSGRSVYSGSRPKMPKAPLIQGVLPMLLSATILIRGIVLSLVLVMVVWLASGALMPGQVGVGSIFSLFPLMAACIFGLLWLMAISALWISIVTDSSDGHQQLINPPGIDFTEWMGSLGYMVVGVSVAALPAAAIYAIPAFEELPWAVAAAAVTVWFLCFPVVLLSMLEIGSPSGVFSVRFALALVKHPGAWLLFLLESSLVVAVAIVVAALLVQISLWMVLLAAPVLLGATFVYFRLLGRLAWWIAEVG